MINTSEIAKEYRLAHWAGLMRERVQSGLSVKEFCARLEMHQNRYFYWQRKLREAALGECGGMPKNAETALFPQGWTTITTARETPERDGAEITVEVGGFHINVQNGTDAELLLKVCRTLKSLC